MEEVKGSAKEETSKKKVQPSFSNDLKHRLLSKHDEDFVCSVCSDRASGYHYGVPACEGCKAFFKRSLQQQKKEMDYKCPGNSSCNIDKMSRKCCQACRLKKCKDVGMSREYLGNKMKKPKLEKNSGKKSKKSEKSIDMNIDSPPTERDQEFEDIINTVCSLHNIMYTSENIANKNNIKETFCSVVAHQLVCIIDWAKRLPGYRHLEITDQAILLQAGWVELLLLHWLYCSVSVEGIIKLADNMSLNASDAENLGIKNIYNLVYGLAHRSKKYKLDEKDTVFLKVIALVNSESSNLTNGEAVNDLIRKYTAALRYYSTTRYYSNSQKYTKMILILPQLKYLANQLIEFFYTMKLNDQEHSLLSDLLVEMLEAKQRL